MNYIKAVHIFNRSCYNTLGVDENDQEVTAMTTFGAIVLGAGLPSYMPSRAYSTHIQDLQLIADWFDVMRRAIEDEIQRLNMES